MLQLSTIATPAILLSVLLALRTNAASVPSAACGADELAKHIPWTPKANETRMFKIGGSEVHITIPPDYSKDEPGHLIFAFHDADMSPAQLGAESQLSDPKVNPGAVVVYPLAKEGSWQSDVRPLRPGQEARKKTDRNDVEFTLSLIEDLQQVICFDVSNIHATGMGTGGGMMHMLACNPDASIRIASFASVAGGYGRDDEEGEAVWGNCNPGRKPVPILEIHGNEDYILPYYLNSWENTKTRLAVPAWLEQWSEINGCGEETLEEVDSEKEKRTTLTRLEGGGVLSKGDSYGTGITRSAKACPAVEDDEGKPVKEVKELPLSDPEPEQISLLHYRLPSIGHAWAKQQFRQQPDLQDEDDQEEGSKKSKKKKKKLGKLKFDTTVIVLDWFNDHALPERLAKKWRDEDEQNSKQRAEEAAQRKADDPKEKEKRRMLEHIDKMVKSGKMTKEEAKIFRAKVEEKPINEYAGYSEEEQDDDEDEPAVEEEADAEPEEKRKPREKVQSRDEL